MLLYQSSDINDMNAAERRRLQNRIAQRNHRRYCPRPRCCSTGARANVDPYPCHARREAQTSLVTTDQRHRHLDSTIHHPSAASPSLAREAGAGAAVLTNIQIKTTVSGFQHHRASSTQPIQPTSIRTTGARAEPGSGFGYFCSCC